MRRSVLLLMFVACSARAGVYSPDDPCPFNVKPDGTAEALPHRLFVAQLVDRLAPRVPNTPDPPGIPDWAYDGNTAQSTYAARLGQQVAARWPLAQQLRGDDLAAHSAALLRFNASQQALNLLDRGRVGRSYPLKANRTHAFTVSGQWADAETNLPDDPETPPTPTAGTTEVQFLWQRKLDQTVYRRWLVIRSADADPKIKPPVPELTPDLLFVTTDGQPIRYWQSEVEAKKLPPDAVATVQQLLLWAPWDDRLLWSLAEVYFATGRIREAHSAYEMLASDAGRKFQGPRLLGPQVSRVAAEYAKLPPEEFALPSDIVIDTTPDPKPELPPRPLMFGLVDPVTFYFASGLFIAVLLLMVALQVRAILRRRKSAHTSS